MNEQNTQEIKAMLNAAEDRLSSAKLNHEHGLYNDSISRSYYAAFHAVSAILFSTNIRFSSHSQVMGAFNRDYIKTGVFSEEIGKMFVKLFKYRQSADYDYYSRYSEEESKTAIDNAELILNAVKNYFSLNEAG